VPEGRAAYSLNNSFQVLNLSLELGEIISNTETRYSNMKSP